MIRTIIVIGIVLVAVGAFFMWKPQILAALKGWRTIIWNGIVAAIPILGVVVQQLQAFDFTPYMTPTNAIIAGLLVSGIGFWLRYITTGPIGDKDA